MKINNKTVVQYHHTLTDETETLMESTEGTEPPVYLHGAGNIIAGLEAVMEGKSQGDKFSAIEQGFGTHKAGQIERMSVKHFRGAKNVEDRDDSDYRCTSWFEAGDYCKKWASSWLMLMLTTPMPARP